MARELRQMTSRCLLGTDQPVTELHDSLHFTGAAGISVDISPGTGDRSGIPRPQPSTPRALPGAGVSLGRAPGTRDFPDFQGAHSARGNAVSSAPKAQDCVPLLPGPLGLNNSLARSDAQFSHL